MPTKRQQINQEVRERLIAWLRGSCRIDSDDPDEIKLATAEQERIAARIELTVRTTPTNRQQGE